LEACTFVANQHQAFEAGFQMKVIYVWGKVELKSGLDEWWRDQPRCLGWGTKQSLGAVAKPPLVFC
jgi:hypothetical protein